MTAYISNFRIYNDDHTIWVKMDLWQGADCTSHVLPVSVATGLIDTSEITSKNALLALLTAQKDAFIGRVVTQRRKDVAARLLRQQEREAA